MSYFLSRVLVSYSTNFIVSLLPVKCSLLHLAMGQIPIVSFDFSHYLSVVIFNANFTPCFLLIEYFLFLQSIKSRIVWGGAASYEENKFEILNEINRGNIIAVIDKNLKENVCIENGDNNNNNNNDINNNERIRNIDNIIRHKNISKLTIESANKKLFNGWSEESCARLRATLENILSHNSSYSSFWILYVNLECFLCRYLEAKKVFFRAVNSVGYCKNIWTLVYGPLRPIFTVKELEEMKDVIVEDKSIFLRSA